MAGKFAQPQKPKGIDLQLQMKILVVRFSSIGDIVLTTPVLRCLKQQLPNAEIYYATKASYTQLLQSNPYINGVVTLGKDWSQFMAEVKQHRFDLIVDLHNNLRTRRMKLRLPWVPFYRFKKANFRKWLLVRHVIKTPVKHVVHRYMETVNHLGVQYDGEGLDFFGVAETLPCSLPDKFTAYAMGGTWATKRMPLNKMEELIY
ncbi:MAG: glycosyltransferase family 9 protein, partial [Sediminibacterium sp.]|nr:glycosyltransferase family 9 protein [Sediminibacterium sp.]